MPASYKLSKDIFDLDPEAETRKITEGIYKYTIRYFKKKGAVIALSGGIDSTLCTHLSVLSLKENNVIALIMPERDSSATTREKATGVAANLGINYQLIDISSVLEAIGCYREIGDAIKELFPDYETHWKFKISISGRNNNYIPFFRLHLQYPDGEIAVKRLPHGVYLRLISAMNYKQRIRKNIEYHYADRFNYTVIGTANRIEYDQGFFVKNGDGSADIKPIAHLYKAQVHNLARYLKIDQSILEQTPTTDTYSLPQPQDEFYFSLPFPGMDYALWALNHNISVAELAGFLEMEPGEAESVYRDIKAKRKATVYNHAGSLFIEDIPEIPCKFKSDHA